MGSRKASMRTLIGGHTQCLAYLLVPKIHHVDVDRSKLEEMGVPSVKSHVSGCNHSTSRLVNKNRPIHRCLTNLHSPWRLAFSLVVPKSYKKSCHWGHAHPTISERYSYVQSIQADIWTFSPSHWRHKASICYTKHRITVFMSPTSANPEYDISDLIFVQKDNRR